jgi:hypothetical protein
MLPRPSISFALSVPPESAAYLAFDDIEKDFGEYERDSFARRWAMELLRANLLMGKEPLSHASRFCSVECLIQRRGAKDTSLLTDLA